jgi:hypothetical protein
LAFGLTEYDGPEKVSYREMSVVLSQEGKPVAEVNLATLFAWATGHEGE